LQTLTELAKQSRIGRLEVINVAVHPQRAARQGIRSVPWLLLGERVLDRSYSADQLREWADKATTPEGLGDYFVEQLAAGRLPRVSQIVVKHPDHLAIVLRLARNPATELAIRLGISAIIEDWAGRPELLAQLALLA